MELSTQVLENQVIPGFFLLFLINFQRRYVSSGLKICFCISPSWYYEHTLLAIGLYSTFLTINKIIMLETKQIVFYVIFM